ncbi:MAG TPA: glycoside hydrolase family 97 catalytic domain-containing protein [Gemmatimonadales bacterium]|jgi:alpha-glucosidase|nr:glycoside hydrolase family 97 catalytic domain-containing protein [Gemmatimonadales bacterium]
MQRREFLAAALAAHVLPLHARADSTRVASPNGAIAFQLLHYGSAPLRYAVTFRDQPVIEPSPLTMLVDGVDLGQGAQVIKVESYQGNEHYAWRGVHSEAHGRFKGARIALRHLASTTEYVVEVRVFDDGIGFRCVVLGEGTRVPDETTAFVLPAQATVWYHDLHGHYEGTHTKKDISEVTAGDWAAPPLTLKLPNALGYAAITEAAVIRYSGMALQADGQRAFRTRLGHAHPASYPFTLRYGQEEATRLAQPAAIAGRITTPWRVVMIGPDLNTLVNCDIVHDLSPPPDPRLFPQGPHTAWLKPGRAVWKYLDGGGANTLDTTKEFSLLAGQLGFEYNLVEGFWRRWSDSELRELIDFSRQHNVGIWLWQHSREIRDAGAREAFFAHVQGVGAVGVKLDFFDHEAKEVMDLYQACLQGAAEHRLMVDFHGANKPTGESRTWPNELTREAVSGMERRSMPAWATHDTTVPFTRMLAGHLDFTPMLFGERRRETSWAHQIATAAIFTSPLLVYGAHPRAILDHPAAPLIKAIPSVWDETRVLPFSEIGEVAALARRRSRQWFLAIANGPAARSVEVPLSFLGGGSHEALLVRDQADDPAAVQVEHATVRRGDSLQIDLRAAGGFVARF